MSVNLMNYLARWHLKILHMVWPALQIYWSNSLKVFNLMMVLIMVKSQQQFAVNLCRQQVTTCTLLLMAGLNHQNIYALGWHLKANHSQFKSFVNMRVTRYGCGHTRRWRTKPYKDKKNCYVKFIKNKACRWIWWITLPDDTWKFYTWSGQPSRYTDQILWKSSIWWWC